MDNQNLALPDLVRIDHIISQNIQLQERVNRLEIREVAHNLVRIELQRENMELRAELRERIMLPDLVVVVSCAIILIGAYAYFSR
ncbi:unnamed protein product [Rotaria socialis]|uniref:Uncharacterized protein n=1 Tax=Rotaria socialis TaxID=392032 RepID=A0A818ATB7_9BILA|nr:unnamed protein product [Rotaria socialis]CAF3466948.1 unnamed protein product [Rotaria socialis]